jgi:hypothetical protein
MKKLLISALLVAASSQAAAQKFYPDDPLKKELQPRDASGVKSRKLNDYYDLLENSYGKRGQHGTTQKGIPAGDVNTLGEPLDGAWYTHRHYWDPMTIEQLQLGAGGKNPPSESGQWTIVSAKSEGITPGFVIKDSKGDHYYVKFDPISNPEMATGAEMIVARIFYALGYHVPDYYLIHFTPEKLILGKDVKFHDSQGRERTMVEQDLNKLLKKVPRAADGQYRGIVSTQIPGKPVGPYKYFGTRGDDPNDVVPHEHRRELRGLYVFAEWLAHNDSRAINSLDTLVEEDGVTSVRHYLMDFGATLGSASTMEKTARAGGEYYLDLSPAPKEIATFGLAVPRWQRAHYPNIPSVGGFDYVAFQPDNWKPDYPNQAFRNRLPDDEFWAAKQLMAFSDEQIRGIVKVAQYSDPRAEDYIAKALIARRDKIGQCYFAKVLPLDRFIVQDGRLAFHDLAQDHAIETKGELHATWSRFDNATNQKAALEGAQDFRVPIDACAPYLAADLWRGDDHTKTVTVYLRCANGTAEVVGIDRTWPPQPTTH